MAIIKRFAVLGLLVATYVSAWAQNDMYKKDGEDPKVFTGGAIMGLNFAQVDGDSYYSYHKVGLHAGALVYVHFNNRVGASMEMLYTRKGSRGITVTESPAIGTYIIKYNMDINYIEVPLLFHYISHNIDFETGVSFAYMVNSQESILTDQLVIIDPVANRFNSTDVDVNFGVTKKIYNQLYASCRYQYSLVSIRPPERVPVGYSYGNIGQFNNLFNLRLVYLF